MKPETEETEELNIEDGGDPGDEADHEDRGDVVAKVDAAIEQMEEETDPPEEAGPKFIPKGRFNEVNEALKAERAARLRLEEDLARARGAAPARQDDGPEVEPDLKAMRKQRNEALMEGDTDKAEAIEEQIDAIREERATAKAIQRMQQSQQLDTFKTTVSAVIKDYPFLDSDSAAKNEDAIEMVVALRDRHIANGKSPAEALRLAAEKVGPRFEAQDDAQDEDPAKTKADELKAARIRRNADAANRQPSTLNSGVGARATAGKVNVEDLDDDAFAALPEKERARLRGDIA